MRFIGDLCLEQEHDSCTRADCECMCHDDKRDTAHGQADPPPPHIIDLFEHAVAARGLPPEPWPDPPRDGA